MRALPQEGQGHVSSHWPPRPQARGPAFKIQPRRRRVLWLLHCEWGRRRRASQRGPTSWAGTGRGLGWRLARWSGPDLGEGLCPGSFTQRFQWSWGAATAPSLHTGTGGGTSGRPRAAGLPVQCSGTPSPTLCPTSPPGGQSPEDFVPPRRPAPALLEAVIQGGPPPRCPAIKASRGP